MHPLFYIREDFRTLIAGGGTNFVTGFVSEQLNNTQSELVYIDFSKNSMHLAQILIRILKTRNIIWVKDWIECVPRLGVGMFHFMISTGVLHHLKDPSKGLNIIKEAQPQNGGALIMLYAKYGRIGVYQTQYLLKLLRSEDSIIEKEIKYSRMLIDELPITSWFLHGNHSDYKTDVGLYDLLLHKRDVAYSLNNLYEFLDNTSYNLIDFSEIKNRIILSNLSHIEDNELNRIIMTVSIRGKIAAELVYGQIKKHVCYISKDKNSEADVNSPNNRLFLYGVPIGLKNVMYDGKIIIRNRNMSYISAKLMSSQLDEKTSQISTKKYIGDFFCPWSKSNNIILSIILEHSRMQIPVSKVISRYKYKAKSNVNSSVSSIFKTEFLSTYNCLKGIGFLLLRSSDVKIRSMSSHNQFYVQSRRTS